MLLLILSALDTHFHLNAVIRVRDLPMKDLAMRCRDSLLVTLLQQSQIVCVVVDDISENVLQIQARVSGIVAFDIIPVITLLAGQQRILLLAQVMMEVVVRVLRFPFRDNCSILGKLLAVVVRVTVKAMVIRVLRLVEVVLVV